jgi:hypothetical protein
MRDIVEAKLAALQASRPRVLATGIDDLLDGLDACIALLGELLREHGNAPPRLTNAELVRQLPARLYESETMVVNGVGVRLEDRS